MTLNTFRIVKIVCVCVCASFLCIIVLFKPFSGTIRSFVYFLNKQITFPMNQKLILHVCGSFIFNVISFTQAK